MKKKAVSRNLSQAGEVGGLDSKIGRLQERFAAITISIERNIHIRRDTSMLRLKPNTLNITAVKTIGDGTGSSVVHSNRRRKNREGLFHC